MLSDQTRVAFRSGGRRDLALAVACALTFTLLLGPQHARADTISSLQQEIANDQQQVAQISSQIGQIDTQIGDLNTQISKLRDVLGVLQGKLAQTENRLVAEQSSLQTLEDEEAKVTAELQANQADLVVRQAQFSRDMRTLDQIEHAPVVGLLITSSSFSQFFERMSDVQQVSDHDHHLAVQIQDLVNQLAAQRRQLDAERVQQAQVVDTITAEKQVLDGEYGAQAAAMDQISYDQAVLFGQQAQLTSQSQNLNTRIAIDQSEVSQLASFSEGRIGAGGAVIAPEVLSDGWGTYYNQRDARWGNDYVGSSPYMVWEIGCLISSVAMVHTHFGDPSFSPANLALNPGNFDSGGDMYWSALDVPGHPAAVQNNPSVAWIDSYLTTGGTVIAGMYIYTGGTHFVVLKGMIGAYDYSINDPWEPNAMSVSFNSSPVTGPIFVGVGYH